MKSILSILTQPTTDIVYFMRDIVLNLHSSIQQYKVLMLCIQLNCNIFCIFFIPITIQLHHLNQCLNKLMSNTLSGNLLHSHKRSIKTKQNQIICMEQ